MNALEITRNIMNIVKNKMKSENISYGDLKQRTGIPKSTLQRYVMGTVTKIPIDSVEKIAAALNISMEIAAALNPIPSEQSNIPSSNVTINHSVSSLTLTLQEENMVKKYRCLTPEGKETVDTILDLQYKAVAPKVKSETAG